MELCENKTYYLRENKTGQEHYGCRFRYVFGKDCIRFYFDVKDEDIISPYRQDKFRLEQEIDNMPLDAKYRERKIQDMTTRLESLYETMIDLEGLIKDAQLRKNAIEEDVMTMENIYRLLLSFSQIYDKMDDIEKKNLLSYLIKRIDIYANDEGTTQVLKSIEFNFPIYKDGTFVRKILLDERVNVETLVLLCRK